MHAKMKSRNATMRKYGKIDVLHLSTFCMRNVEPKLSYLRKNSVHYCMLRSHEAKLRMTAFKIFATNKTNTCASKIKYDWPNFSSQDYFTKEKGWITIYH